jgi:glycosyltransferase involved in cell wall biosynthesis
MANYAEKIFTFDISKYAMSNTKPKLNTASRIHAKIGRRLAFGHAVKEMKDVFLQLVQKESFEVVLFHGKSIFSVIRNFNDLPLVVDFCDATSMRIKSRMRYDRLIKLPWLLLSYYRVRRIEKELIRKTPHLAFITCRDRDAILGSSSNAEVVPLGMDFEYWTRQTHNPKSNCILYSGGMDYRPNVDGALYLIEKILPLVRQSIPKIEVLIVGRNPAPMLISKAQQYPDITVTGTVEDMRPYFEQATVYVAPLRFASGLQNKLLEAMAMEVPVVTTSIAAEGLRINGDYPPLVVGGGQRNLAEGIVHLLKNKEDRVHLSSEGRQFIQKHFIWSRNAAILEKMCLKAVASDINTSRRKN